MKNKPVIFIGVVIAICLSAGIFILNNKKGPSQSNQVQTNNSQSGNKEIEVGTDICGEFAKEWVSTSLGKQIIKTEENSSSGTYVCQYYVDESNFVTLRLNNLNVENQKKGQTSLGRTITTNPEIKMEHFVVLQDNGLINGIYLVLNPNLFIAIDRTSTKAASEDEMANFAVKVAERVQSGGNIAEAPTAMAQTTVSLPQGEDIARNFFSLIGEGKIEDAIEMMTPSAIGDDSQKQAWGVQFNAFKKIIVKKVEPTMENTYKVTLDIEMKPESANAPIPYYGYENGSNFRWISLEKIDNSWKITGIATGP